MKEYTRFLKATMSIFIIFVLLGSMLIPSIVSDSVKIKDSGFEKGIPWQPFKPMKKTTLVGFDKETLIDDYAYLASIPASVFSNGETIYSSPLLLFQPDNTYPDDEEHRFLNDYQGTHYLMEDWMGYCDGRLDKLTTINVDDSDLESDWKSREQTSLKGDDPFKLTSEIVLDEWSYSDEVIIAVIEEDYEKPTDAETTGSIDGKISGEVKTDSLTVKRSYGIAPEYKEFTVGEEYKYVKAHLWFPAIVYYSKALASIPGFGSGKITLPSVDPDLQLFVNYEGDWLQTSSASEMTITNGPYEDCFSYVYEPGSWKVGVTNMPTQGGDLEQQFFRIGKGNLNYYGNSKWEAVKNAFLGSPITDYNVDLSMYPGVEEIIPDLPPFGCRDATFTLKWDDKDIALGLTIIGPSGEELDSVMDKDTDEQELHFDMLGECLEGEHYKAVVYALDDVLKPVDFTVEYIWQQSITRKEGDLLASACQGAILGSTQNNPMLYVTPDEVPACTKDTLYKLGVKQLNIVDLGGYLSEETKDELSNIAEIKEHYTEYKDVYDAITETTGSNDVVFSTIDPWSYWYYKTGLRKLKPDGVFGKAFYFGPAAYAAAHHGSPLLLVDNHPELSGAVTWHGDSWRKNAHGLETPPIAPMFLTGSKAYDFLDEYGFDKKGQPESILTVAGQYDIGPTWTRVFAGVANPGNIIGTPVDTTNHISRCIFYPGLIFQNPALQGKVELETGSESERVYRSFELGDFHPFQGILTRLFNKGSNLKIIKPSRVEEFEYPVLHTYGCYAHRFNERGSKYWNAKYITRDGITPGETPSQNQIDAGTRLQFEGKSGCFYPDISETEVTPLYASRAGYSNAFSTNFDITMDNLNKGVISWYMVLHGVSSQGGELSWYSATTLEESLAKMGKPTLGKIIQFGLGIPLGLHPTTETNPWRGYDMLWGSTKEPDSAAMNTEVGLLRGWLGIGRSDGPRHGGPIKIGLDLIPTDIPFKIPLFDNRDNYFDGLMGPYGLTAMLLKCTYAHPATEIDDKLENLHSMSFHADSCLIGCNYIQIAFMRHGSVVQELDPWGTSYWGGFAFQATPRDLALGKTVGEAYAEGRSQIGIQYLFEDDEPRNWWWDEKQNTVLFTDPDLRIYVPSTEYDQKARNHWEQEDFESLRYDAEFSVDGHMPFGATNYPNEKEPQTLLQQYLWLIITTIVVIILVVALAYISRKKKN